MRIAAWSGVNGTPPSGMVVPSAEKRSSWTKILRRSSTNLTRRWTRNRRNHSQTRNSDVQRCFAIGEEGRSGWPVETFSKLKEKRETSGKTNDVFICFTLNFSSMPIENEQSDARANAGRNGQSNVDFLSIDHSNSNRQKNPRLIIVRPFSIEGNK